MNQFLCGLILFAIAYCNVVASQKVSQEVFGFTNFVPESIYKKYDLTKISSLVFLDNNINDQFLEFARSKNVQTYLTSKSNHNQSLMNIK